MARTAINGTRTEFELDSPEIPSLEQPNTTPQNPDEPDPVDTEPDGTEDEERDEEPEFDVVFGLSFSAPPQVLGTFADRRTAENGVLCVWYGTWENVGIPSIRGASISDEFKEAAQRSRRIYFKLDETAQYPFPIADALRKGEANAPDYVGNPRTANELHYVVTHFRAKAIYYKNDLQVSEPPEVAQFLATR